MTLRRARRLALSLALLLAGCSSFRCCNDPDRLAGDSAAYPTDAPPLLATAAAGEESHAAAPVPHAPEKPVPEHSLQPVPVPRTVPGADVPPIDLPPLEKGKEEARAHEIDRLYPPLPPLGESPVPLAGPERAPLELTDLQALAMANSPLVRQAAADVDAARGAMMQAGAYPNPTVGVETDAIGQGGEPTERVTAGQLGGFVEQTIKTKGKLGLARAAAEQDLRGAELTLTRTRFDVLARVRGGYFAVLAAQENLRVALAFARFTEAVYRIQVGQLRAGEVAPYEPLQFRALAVQARVTLAQARHRYLGAWRQLAAALATPDRPPAPLAGRIDMPVPAYRYEDVAAHVLARHTDVLSARAALERARYNLRLAQVTPAPDIGVRVLVQKDYTTEPHNVMTSVQVGGPIPLWNQNRGGIIQAEAQLVRATEEERRVRDDLARQLADAFERYDFNRELLAPYRGTLLPDQVRVFNGISERYWRAGRRADVTFIDVSTAQQNLIASVTTYLQALAAQRQAVVDIATLLQADDLFRGGLHGAPTDCQPPMPDFDRLLPPPCARAK
jgi:cobalt-zinc-cadmium efflux system outer membrane protein